MPFDDQLEMLYVVLGCENGDRELELRPRGYCDEDHWAVDVSWYDDRGDETEEAAGRERFYIEHLSFSAPTLAEAVSRAWNFYGAPVKCTACDGSGDGREIAEGELAEGSGITTHVGGGAPRYTVACEVCSGEGHLLTTNPLTEKVS